MKARLLSVLLILVTAIVSLSACNVVKDKTYEATGSEYFEFTQREDGNYKLSVKADAELPETVKLPVEFNGKAVVEIVANAFRGNTVIKDVIIPAGYEIIGAEAFALCTKLSSVTIGQQGTSNVKTTIRRSAFKGCSALTTVTLGECVTVIDAYAFAETMIIGLNARGLTKVGAYAFSKCTALKNFYVPANLDEIDETAFSGSPDVVFTVSSSNDVYTVEDGELIKK